MKAGFVRLFAAGATLGVLLLGAAGTAHAQPQPQPQPQPGQPQQPQEPTTNIPINRGNVPTTAADYEQKCDPNLGGGPYVGRDVWVFNLPDNDRDFVSVTATFRIPGDGTRTVIIPEADDSAIVRIGTSKAYVILPAGWVLETATAEVTGEPDPRLRFVLTHTCAAKELPVTGPSNLVTMTAVGVGAVMLGTVLLTVRRRQGVRA